MFLEKYKKNIYSQNGEDGIISELLKRTGLNKSKNKWCCEFGAWDGKHGSNTYNLLEKNNFKAVYIEGDKFRFKKLKELSLKIKDLYPFNKYVSHKNNSKNKLDKILSKTTIKKNFEVLSIDIDSYDLDVWESLKFYSPEIVVIEINSGLKPGIYQKHSKIRSGNSFSSTLIVAKKKGYTLVSHTGNCIFIKKKYLQKIKLPVKFISNPNLLFDWSWILKKENLFKKYLKILFPNFLIEDLRNLKNNFFRQF
jgi:hypothetical protein